MVSFRLNFNALYSSCWHLAAFPRHYFDWIKTACVYCALLNAIATIGNVASTDVLNTLDIVQDQLTCSCEFVTHIST